MTNSSGKRSGTRYKFARAFKKHGMPGLSTYLATVKRGDYVTIKVNGAIQKGMPTGFYHGRTGVVFDVTKSSVGIEVSKRVRGNEILKRLHIRREHVSKSTSPVEFRARRAENDRIARENAGKGIKTDFKRKVDGPSPAKLATGQIVTFAPVPFTESF